MTGDSKFLKAYREFEAAKLEARRLQGELAQLHNRSKALQAELDQAAAEAEAARLEALKDIEARRREHERAIQATEAKLHKMRARVDSRCEGLTGLLAEEMRNP